MAYRQCTRPSLPPAKAWLREAGTRTCTSTRTRAHTRTRTHTHTHTHTHMHTHTHTHTHAHTLYYLQKHKLMLEDHNHRHSPRVHTCDSLFDFSSSMHTFSKIIITAPLIYFSIPLCLSLILDITSPLHTLHGYVTQCTLCPKVATGYTLVFIHSYLDPCHSI